MHEPPLILVIDDSVEFLEIISIGLRGAGFEIKTAVNVAAGTEIARNDMPDLILLDINMPGVNGTEIFLDFKKDPELSKLKVAFLTSMSLPWPGIRDKEKFSKEIGAAMFFDKDMDFETLGQKIKSILGRP
ncbi:MAG TPA: response regulator [Candidatus Paceibacterota bacterium]